MERISLLIADDELIIARLYKEEFLELNYLVDIAYNGRQVIEKLTLRPNFYDVIILDIRMPEMTGIDALRIIKAKWPEIPVILCSAYSEFKQDFSVWNSDDYVVKSSDLTELKESVKKFSSARSNFNKNTNGEIAHIYFQEQFQILTNNNASEDEKMLALKTLYYLDPSKARPIVLEVGFSQESEYWRREVVYYLGSYSPEPELVKLMTAQLKDNSPDVREAICRVLGDWSDPSTKEFLKKRLSDPDESVRIAANKALNKMNETLNLEKDILHNYVIKNSEYLQILNEKFKSDDLTNKNR